MALFGLRLCEDRGVFVACAPSLDLCVDDSSSDEFGGHVGLCAGAAEDQECGPDADLIARGESDGSCDALAVDPCSVLASQVSDKPLTGVWCEFCVSSGDGGVGHREGFACSADHLGFVVWEFEDAPFVWPWMTVRMSTGVNLRALVGRVEGDEKGDHIS